ncbi:MAG: hypothetical protein J2P52_00940 [Blastocatellia bacterium]|nr:hypothetical protein [Blastocatellia bacterium]
MLRRLSLTVAHLLLLALLVNRINGQETQSRKFGSPPGRAGFSGLITSRLSIKELERWKEIERIVFAEDADRRPLHPALRNLWEIVETSGHAVFVEISSSTRTATCTAGSFAIERFDPKGEKHIAVIKLNLSSIDRAAVGPGSTRDNGFIPFQGLSKQERYVEVLGHELAHAVDILTDLERAGKVEDMVEKTNEILLSWRQNRIGDYMAPELNRRLSRRDALLKDLEEQAERMEYVVWQELVASKAAREKER